MKNHAHVGDGLRSNDRSAVDCVCTVIRSKVIH